MAVKEPISPEGLKSLSRRKFEDATILLKNERFDTAYYLCGYAVELALKRQICLSLDWDEYVRKDFYDYLKSFMTHKLDILLFLSGIEKPIKQKYLSPWAAVRIWDSDVRYSTLGVEKKKGRNDDIVYRSFVKGPGSFMSEIFEKLKKSLLKLEQKNGAIILFALFLRADALGKWDLLVSARWLDSDSKEAYDMVADAIQSELEGREIIQLDRFVILDPAEPIVHFLQSEYPVPNGAIKNIVDCSPLTDRLGFPIKQATVLRCVEG